MQRLCTCRLYHTQCNCSWLATGHHPWQYRGVEPYRDILFEISDHIPRVLSAPSLKGHFVRYLTYHPCQFGCDFCVARKRLVRAVFPGLYQGRSELPAISVTEEGDNTNILGGLTSVWANDIIQEGAVPFLHNRHEALRPVCDCLTRFLDFEVNTQPSSGRLMWLYHAHWQQVDEHHPGNLDTVLVPEGVLPPGLPPRVLWSSKGWNDRCLSTRRVKHQSTQTDPVFEVPPLLQTSLAAVIEKNTTPLITPCQTKPEQTPLWVQKYIQVGELVWVCSEYLPILRRREASRARQREADVSVPRAPPPSPDMLP